jgi:predicted Zn-dependent protease
MRPSSFPTIRIACLAALLQKSSHLFSRILETETLTGFEELVTARPSAYWLQHYRFDISVEKTQLPGQTAVHNILINTVLPLLYLYGREKMKYSYQEKAVDLMNKLPAEENSVMDGWEDLGIKARTAQDSQALLQLKHYYCDEKRCLKCAIGVKLLKEDLEDGINWPRAEAS